MRLHAQLPFQLPKTVFSVLALFGLVAGIVACAPATESISRDATPIQSGPKLDDADLKLGQQAPVQVKLNWSGDVSAAVAYRFAENVISLKDTLSAEDRMAWATTFFRSLPHDRVKLTRTAYADLMVEQSQKMAKTSLDEIVPKLKKSPQLIKKTLLAMKRPLGKRESVDLVEAGDRAFRFLKEFNRGVEGIDLVRQVREGLREELGRYIALEGPVRKALKDLQNAKTIRVAISEVVSTARELKIDIPKASSTKLEKARRLGAKVDSFTDAQGALSLLIDVWVFLRPDERASIFKAANADLYDYLQDLSADDLKCLQSPDCFSLPKWLARQLVIFPKLEEFGLEKIRQLVNTSGADAVREEVRAVVLEEVRDLPETIAEKIEKTISEKIGPITRLTEDFAGELRGRLDRWASTRIEKDNPAVYRARPATARLRVNAAGRVEVDWSETSDMNMESAGALSALSSYLWLNGGIDDSEARSLLLAEIATLAKLYRDSQVSSNAAAPAKPKTASARAYAEAIRGAARLAVSFRDWEKNVVDDLVGSFKAQDLFPEFQVPELNQPLFPKTAFFALSFANLADKLKVTTGDKTHVFLIDANNRVVLANEPASEDDAPVMAGIADRIGDQLSPTVRAEDVARYLIAMSETLEAAREIERSTSEYLVEPDKEGKVPRDEIIKSRESIRLLVLGLANYLSHQFRAGGELVRRELQISTQQPYDMTLTVLDQALTIRALLAASRALDTDVYRWEAVDLVSALNRNLYRPDLGFYARSDEKAISPVVMLEALRALDEVLPHLKPQSRKQIESLMAPWRSKISQWRLKN